MTQGAAPLGLVAVVIGGGITPGSNPPQITLTIMVSDNQGHEVGTDVTFPAIASINQTNQAIEARARRAIADAFGFDVPTNTPVRLFGGATS